MMGSLLCLADRKLWLRLFYASYSIMVGFDVLKTASDDSEVAFNSAAWEENYNYKLQFFYVFWKKWRETRRDRG